MNGLWKEIHIQIDSRFHDPLCSFLFDLGTSGIEILDGEIKAYFKKSGLDPLLIQKIENYIKGMEKGLNIPIPFKIKSLKVEEERWEDRWKEFFRPQKVSNSLTIIPAWEDIGDINTEYIIRIDPGIAFGTGMHPTTQMCLKAMEIYRPSFSWRMLDVGTGSGILAIYAAYLGADSIVAIDIDQEALKVAKRNLCINGVKDRVNLICGSTDSIRSKYDMICANLDTRSLIGLCADFKEKINGRGFLILSGILKVELKDLYSRFNLKGFKCRDIICMDEWASIVLEG